MPVAHRSRTAVLAAATVAALALAGCGETTDDPADTIVRTTTRIAEAAVIGVDRDTTTSCALPSPLDAGQPASGTRTVVHTAGTAEVPADPQRIVVLDLAAMDAVCALGLWERVVGTAFTPIEPGYFDYLGTGIAELPSVGSGDVPDLDLVAGVAPDLILGSSVDTDLRDRLGAIAPTVTVGSDPVFWRQQFLRVGDALGRRDAAQRVLDDYLAAAAETGRELASSQTQASIVRFTGDGPVVEGTASFAGQVMADAGADRPPAQRFGVVDGRSSEPVDTDDPAAADADVIFVRFDGEDGLADGTEYMRTDRWFELGAVSDRRLFAVTDDVWSTPGPVAARAVLTDLKVALNGYSN